MIPEFDEMRERLLSLRKELGMTQEEVAEIAGVSQSFVTKLERGKSTSNYGAVARLYNTLRSLQVEDEDTAASLMTAYVVSVAPDDPVRYASSIMKRENYTYIPVIDDGQAFGTVTSMTLLDADQDDQVSEHMNPPLPEVPEDIPRSAVTELLKTTDAVLVRRQNDGIVGIITAADII